jgi:hypothetical protein
LTDVLARSEGGLVLVPNHTRAVVAALHMLRSIDEPEMSVIMREDPRGLTESVVVEALQRPVTARLPWQKTLPIRADDGEPPRGNDGFARACESVLHRVVPPFRRAA